MAVTRARELRWLRLESSGKGGSNQSAAAEAGLKQGSAGCQGMAAAVEAGQLRARSGGKNEECLFG